jgi:hypothetical protein
MQIGKIAPTKGSRHDQLGKPAETLRQGRQ